MRQHSSPLHLKPILSVGIEHEQDLVTVRQRARQLSALLGFGQQDRTRISTAVSEIARNAYQYARGGRLEFSINLQGRPQVLCMQVSDHGPGIRNVAAVLSGAYVSNTGMGVGLTGARRLMDHFEVVSSPGEGTVVRFGKDIPAGPRPIAMPDLGVFGSSLSQQPVAQAGEELQQQNHDLLQTLETLRMRESELEKRQQDLFRLNLELEETNRGVLALYAELDEKAVALRRADEMKTRFLSHVSHEFRTPVNAVLALTRLLLQRTDGELAPEQEKQVAYIRDAAQQLADMVNDLLDLAKVDAGKTELRIAPINISAFFGATRGLMRPLALNESVSLIFEEPEDVLVFESDESTLGQIMRNLISNALKFTQQGEVRVKAGLSTDGNTVLFSVKDTGIGICPEDQKRIFHEFAQLDHPIQKHVKGTGLGLSLSLRLATLLSGNLVVESAAGAGSTFILSLPYSPPPVSDDEVAASNKLSFETGRSKVILLVDDDVAARYLVRRLFDGTTHGIAEANAVEALERARFESPALIILDLAMPDRSGFEVLDDLKSDEATKDIPVVIHSSKEMTEADYARLGDRQSLVLSKTSGNRQSALLEIRKILEEPKLFSSEPEFN